MPGNIRKKILGALRTNKARRRQDLADEILADVPAEEHKKATYAMNRSFKQLSDQGEVIMHKTEFSEFLRLTDKGRKKLTTWQLSSDQVLLPKTWDGMWRFVLLDVSESRKTEREALRYLLQKSRFLCLKNSVWVSPFPLEHLLSQLKDDMGLETELMVLVTDTVDPKTRDMLLQKFFPIKRRHSS